MNGSSDSTSASMSTEEDPVPPSYYSAANTFLQREVYRLGAEPDLRSLPASPERDLLVLTWGPVVYRTTYAPESERLIPVFLRALNEEVARSLSKFLPGSSDQLRLLEKTYASKVFTDSELYESIDEDSVRQSFRDWKSLLGISSVHLPVRLRVCLVIDDGILSRLTKNLDLASASLQNVDFSTCPVKVVEDILPGDERWEPGDTTTSKPYPGWTTVTLGSLVDVFKGLSKGCGLECYHRPGMVYLGSGEWC